jgi:hypothetical protein
MTRFRLSRSREGAMSGLDVAPPSTVAAPQDAGQATPQATPTPGEALYEIGVLLALHLAFAFAVLLALRALGVS